MRKLGGFCILALVVAFVITGSYATCPAKMRDVLRVAVADDARMLDPATVTRDQTGYAVIGAMYDYLVRYPRMPKPDGTFEVDTTRVEPMLAERWEHNAAMSDWTFHLRKDAKFHSGEPVNAHAVKYTFSRALKMKLATHGVLWLAGVTEEGMEVIDDYTIRFRLKTPNPLFLDYLQMQNCGIQDPKAIEAHGGVEEKKPNPWVSRNDTGSGPYRLVRWQPGVEIVIERVEDYWGPKPKSKRIVFKIIGEDATRQMLLVRDEVDLVPYLPAKDYGRMSQNKKLKVIGYPSARVHYIDMNRNKPPFNNILVRKALAYSMPYESIITDVLYGRAAQMTSCLSSAYPSHTDEYFHYKQDLEKAKELLKEAGYENGFSFTFQIGEGRIPSSKAIAITWQASLKKIGIKMDIDVLPQAVFLDKLKSQNVPIFMMAWTSYVTDPWYAYGFLLRSKSFCNYSGIEDKKIDNWYNQAAPMTNKEERYALSKALQKYVAENDLWVYLYQSYIDMAMNLNLQGYQFSPDNQLHLRTVYVEQ